MGLFGRKKKDLTTEGIPGTALIDGQEDASFFDTEESFALTDVGLGSYKLKLWLDVTLDDGRPMYRVVDKFKIPAQFGGWTGRGVKLPIYADPDDPNRLEINWERFDAEGGREAPQPSEAEVAARQAEVHTAMPDASRTMMLNGWITARKAGALSEAEFESALGDAVSSGMVTAEEAAAARTQIG
jgi:hypothetical protein